MRRWWKILAVLALGWVANSPVRAQMPPSPLMFPPSMPPGYYGPPPGYSSGPPPGYPNVPRGYPIPGRDDPAKVQEMLSQGKPPNPLEMTPSGPNAFAEEGPCNPDQGCYVMLGIMALARTPMSSQTVAVLDPNGSVDRNILPPANAPTVLDVNDLKPGYQLGFRGTIGYRYGTEAVELSGWSVFPSTFSTNAVAPGRLDVPFANYPIPIGTGIDNSTWLNADIVTISFKTQVSNLEANYRWGAGTGAELLLGLRYLAIQEQFNIVTNDNGQTVSPPDPRTVVTYQTITNNHIVGPQLGFECDVECTRFLAAGLLGKGMVGANFLNTNVSLFRDDGFTAFSNHRTSTQVAGALELGGYFDFLLLEGLRFRLGYQMLWAFNVAEAASQVDYNIAENPYGSRNDHGNILYHGPFLEFNFAF